MQFIYKLLLIVLIVVVLLLLFFIFYLFILKQSNILLKNSTLCTNFNNKLTSFLCNPILNTCYTCINSVDYNGSYCYSCSNTSYSVFNSSYCTLPCVSGYTNNGKDLTCSFTPVLQTVVPANYCSNGYTLYNGSCYNASSCNAGYTANSSMVCVLNGGLLNNPSNYNITDIASPTCNPNIMDNYNGTCYTKCNIMNSSYTNSTSVSFTCVGLLGASYTMPNIPSTHISNPYIDPTLTIGNYKIPL